MVWRITAKKIFHFENVQDIMQLPLSHSLSLLSVGAKSHVSTASGCVDSFTNRNVKRHTQGGLRDKEELNGAGNHSSSNPHQQPRPREAKSVMLKHLDWFILIAYCAPLSHLDHHQWWQHMGGSAAPRYRPNFLCTADVM